MSHIHKVRTEDKHVVDTVLTFTGLTDGEYSGHMYEMGCEFVMLITNDRFIADQIQLSPIYWGWWKKEWMRRDDIFASTTQMIFHTAISRRAIWFDWHGIDVMVGQGKTAIELLAGFNRIISLIIREETNRHV